MKEKASALHCPLYDILFESALSMNRDYNNNKKANNNSTTEPTYPR